MTQDTTCKCKGTGLVLVDNVKQVCECVLKNKLKLKLDKTLGFYNIVPDILKPIKDIDSSSNIYISSKIKNQGILNGIIAYLWTRCGKSSIDNELKVISAYEIADVFVGKSSIYTSIFDINMKILVILHGFCEYPNKGLEDILLQLMDNRRRLSLYTWFITLGDICSLSKVHSYMITEKYNKYNFQNVRSEKGLFNI